MFVITFHNMDQKEGQLQWLCYKKAGKIIMFLQIPYAFSSLWGVRDCIAPIKGCAKPIIQITLAIL